MRTLLRVHNPCLDPMGGAEFNEILGVWTCCFKDKDYLTEIGKGLPEIRAKSGEALPILKDPLVCAIKDGKLFLCHIDSDILFHGNLLVGI
jgi:hypothetical protein